MFLATAFLTDTLLATGQSKLKEVTEGASEAGRPSKQAEPPTLKVIGPEDEFNRGVPRSSVAGFLKATQVGDYERAAEYLDLQNLPRGMRKSDGPDLAQKLKVVLDRALWIDLNLLSDDPEGYADDKLPAYRDLLGSIETSKKTFNIFLQRVRRSDRVSIWKFSNDTVVQIPQMYDLLGYGRIGEVLSAIFPDVELFGARLWQWVGLAILLILAYLAVLPLMWIVTRVLRWKGGDLSIRISRFIAGPIRFLAWVLISRASIDLIGPTVTMRAIIQAGTILIIAVVWTVIRLIDFFQGYLADRFETTARSGAVVLLRPLRNMVLVVIVIVAILLWLDNMGLKVTTLIAGIGVGGVALALAAQKTVEDLFGTVTLYTSQPVRVGDFGRFGNTLGTVEEIGLRMTRVRTLDHTLVSIPNADFAKLPLENFTKREKIWYHPRIGLRYETTRDQVRTVIANIEKLLKSHEKVIPDSARIRFTEIGEYSLNLDVFAYIKETDYAEYLKVAEGLNLKMMEIVEQAGTQFAFPSQTTYLETGKEGISQFLRGDWAQGEKKQDSK